MRWTWASTVNPLSVSLFITRVRCSIPICVALFPLGLPLSGVVVRPQWGNWVGSLGLVSMLCLRMPSTVVSCLLLNTPRCVAWYSDFSNCSMAIALRGGLSLRFDWALANLLTSLVMWRMCSRKSSMGLMLTSSIFYDLIGCRYLIWVPFANVLEWICSCSMV